METKQLQMFNLIWAIQGVKFDFTELDK